MNILIIKTSSMGDLIHALPALTDAGQALGKVGFDWVAEEMFAEIPIWHPLVNQVIPISQRRWRKHFLQSWRQKHWQTFIKNLRQKEYDVVIDAQGLLKSAWIARLSRGKRCGYDFNSARESLASCFYQRKFAIDRDLHAITRIRQLFARSLGYSLPETAPQFGLNKNSFNHQASQAKYLVFLHGASRAEKCWQIDNWMGLAQMAQNHALKVVLPWGNVAEKQRADEIAKASANVQVLAKSSLTEIAGVLAHSTGVIAVDSGLAHLAAVLTVPTVTLFGPTDPGVLAISGQHCEQLKLSLQQVSPDDVTQVWRAHERLQNELSR